MNDATLDIAELDGAVNKVVLKCHYLMQIWHGDEAWLGFLHELTRENRHGVNRRAILD